MAAKEDSDDNIKKQEVDDITTCCICIEVYTDPKALPCIHTFCKKCIEETGFRTNKGPGDEMPCPVCRQLFKIPPEGFRGLPKHFFIERLIQASKGSDPSLVSRALCTLCLEESNEQEEKETPTADTYCVDCKNKLCEECTNEHKKFKMTKNHKLIPLNEYESGQNVTNDRTSSSCELHRQKVLDVFCSDCKTFVCAICFIEDHKNHEGSHVDKLVTGFRKQIESNAETINDCRCKARKSQAELLQMKSDIQERVEKLQYDIENRKAELIQLIEKHAVSLLHDLCSIKQSKLKEIQMAADDIGAYLSSIDTYNLHSQKIITNGSASDICGAFSDLTATAMELQQQCQPTIDRDIQFFDFSFRKLELEEYLEEGCGNIIDEIDEWRNIERQRLMKETETKQEEYFDNMRLKDLEAELLDLKQNLEEERRLWAEERCELMTQAQEMQQEISVFSADLESEMLDLKRNLEEERRLWAVERCELMTQAQEMQQEISDSSARICDLQKKFEEERIAWKEEKDQFIKEAQKFRKESAVATYVKKPKLVKKIDLGHSVWGLAMLSNELFVASADEMAIFVYDTVTYNLLRTIDWKGSRGPRDIAACQQKNCLFAVDLRSGLSLFCINQKGETLKRSNVPYEPHNLSVMPSGDILLTCNARILIYNSDGGIIQNLRLYENALDKSWQTILLTSGNYLLCQGWMTSKHHRVLILDQEGDILKSFGRDKKHSNHHLSDPVHMAIGRDESVIVADSGNNRVVLLSRDLVFLRELISEKDGVTEPYRVLLDEASKLLYVGTNKRQLLICNVFQ